MHYFRLTPGIQAPLSTTQYLFVPGGNVIYVYNINQPTGAIAQVTGSPFLAGTSGAGTALVPFGQYFYAPFYNGTNYGVYGYTLNSSTGNLSQIPNSPFSAGTKPQYMTVIQIPQP